MKREKELIKNILQAFENNDGWPTSDYREILKDLFQVHPENKIHYHLELLIERGFLHRDTSAMVSAPSNEGFFEYPIPPNRLTDAGHDFLENAQNKRFWDKAVDVAGNASLDVFATVLKEIAVMAIRSQIGFP